MPCYSLLGVEICIPSIDDIVNAVLYPIVNVISEGLEAVITNFGSISEAVINTIAPMFQGVADAVISFVSDPLSSIQGLLSSVWGVLQGLGSQITGALEGALASISGSLSSLWASISGALSSLGASLMAGLSSLGSSLESFIISSGNALMGAINTAGAAMSSALETTGNVLLTAFDGMGNAISGIMGGIFSGFGSADVNAVVGSHSTVFSLLSSVLGGLEARHSPITPDQAREYVNPFIWDVTGACTTLHVTNMVTESLSLGQIDVSLQEAWRYPTTASALSVATELSGMPLREGLYPAFKRWILATYQPNIPPYQDLISIYVKEGYLEDHWVEIPQEMITNFRELGYSEYWTQRLWGKHWVYPSPTQLYEMLHRTAGTRPDIGVTEEILRNMLKLHDFEPKWRPRLEAISWRTWRIYDIRTAWEMGVEPDAQILKRLIDSGFNPKEADALLDVQKMFVLRTEIDAITREADSDFIEGWISEDQLRADYAGTPYNKDVIELRIARDKLRRDRDLKKDLKTAFTDRFKKGDISETDFSEALSKLGVVQVQISAEVERVRAYKLTKVTEETAITTKSLTEAKYSKAFKVGLIPESTYRQKLASFKYGDDDINLLVELNAPEKPPAEELKILTAGELKAAFRAMVLTSSELRGELAARKYTPPDIATIVMTELKKWKDEDLSQAFRRDIITEAEFRAELKRREKPPEEIERIIIEEKTAKRGLAA